MGILTDWKQETYEAEQWAIRRTFELQRERGEGKLIVEGNLANAIDLGQEEEAPLETHRDVRY